MDMLISSGSVDSLPQEVYLASRPSRLSLERLYQLMRPM